MSSILSYIGNTTQAIGNVFGSFFDTIANFILVPLIVFFGIVIFFGIQYYIIKLYIFLGKSLISGIVNILSIGSGEGILNKFTSSNKKESIESKE